MKNRTKEFIKKLGIVQKDLARELGVSTIAIQQMMKSEQPKISTLERVAEKIGVPTWRLLLTDEEIEEIAREHDKTLPEEENRIVCPRCGAILNVKLA